MAIAIYLSDEKQFLFNIDDKQCDLLTSIFEAYRYRTGLVIDPYGNSKLTTENQQTLVNIIDQYVKETDLNKDKQKTTAILELRALMKLSIANNYTLLLAGD